jgi:TRAP-type transport system periplasmic protein
MSLKLLSKVLVWAALSAFTLPGQSQAQQTLRIAGNFPVDHSSSVAMETFRTELAAISGGKLAADLFPGMQLGGAKENMDAVRAGTIFGTWIGVAYVSRLVPEVEAVSLPFVFDNREQAMGAIDGPVGKLIDEKLAAKGFKSLGWMELGSRHVTNSKRPLKTIDDFKGLKIRMQPNETHLATFRAIGAIPPRSISRNSIPPCSRASSTDRKIPIRSFAATASMRCRNISPIPDISSTSSF